MRWFKSLGWGTEGETEFFVEWIEQWSQFVQQCNWYTFNFACIEFEDDRQMGGVETTLILLGLGFRARWNYRRTELVEQITEDIEELLANKPATEKSHEVAESRIMAGVTGLEPATSGVTGQTKSQ